MVWLILAKYSYNFRVRVLPAGKDRLSYSLHSNWLRITCGMQSTPSVLEVVKKKKNYEH